MTVNIVDYMNKHGLTDEALDDMAAAYEKGDYPASDGIVYSGSHLDAVGKNREALSSCLNLMPDKMA